MLKILLVSLLLIGGTSLRLELNGGTLKPGTKVGAKDVLEFDLKDVKPEVAFLRVTSDTSDHYFSFNQKLHLNVHVERSLQPGKFQLTVITSQPNNEEKAGTIEVEYELSKAEVARLENSETKLWAKRPEYLHVFRGEPKKAPILVALVFAGLLAVPWLILLGLLAKARISIQFTMILRNVLFHGVVGLMLFVMWVYWIRATIFPTLGLLTVLSLVLVVLPVSSSKAQHLKKQ
jgi:hypothetical protein